MTSEPIDYKTHILIGIRASGTMTVIKHWSGVPRQAEVDQQIRAAKDGYTLFALCTPTSILPAS
jgi:hypothetical protein